MYLKTKIAQSSFCLFVCLFVCFICQQGLGQNSPRKFNILILFFLSRPFFINTPGCFMQLKPD